VLALLFRRGSSARARISPREQQPADRRPPAEVQPTTFKKGRGRRPGRPRAALGRRRRRHAPGEVAGSSGEGYQTSVGLNPDGTVFSRCSCPAWGEYGPPLQARGGAGPRRPDGEPGPARTAEPVRPGRGRAAARPWPSSSRGSASRPPASPRSSTGWRRRTPGPRAQLAVRRAPARREGRRPAVGEALPVGRTRACRRRTSGCSASSPGTRAGSTASSSSATTTWRTCFRCSGPAGGLPGNGAAVLAEPARRTDPPLLHPGRARAKIEFQLPDGRTTGFDTSLLLIGRRTTVLLEGQTRVRAGAGPRRRGCGERGCASRA
jgi:hypothetical protein